MKEAVLLLCLFTSTGFAQPAWQTSLDSQIHFYQTTDLGIVLAATDKSLYAVDGSTGERLWRRETGKIAETAVTQIPDTDLVLLSLDLGSRSRLEAVDLATGARLWQSDKIKGDVMQLAADPELDLLAVVLVRNPRGKADGKFDRRPDVHVLQLSTGEELWKRSLDSTLEMMPARFGVDGEVDHTLDNYRAPLLLDGRLFLFYDGSTSYDARTGKEKEREKFKMNESGLALTEADPIFDDTHVYVSGRGRIRAINRRTGKDDWKASDLGITAEMAKVGDVIYVRTGGQFTRLKDGEIVEKGPFGVAAIDSANGKTLWKYKGADKGLTNFVFADADTIVLADRDDLITIDTRSGKRLSKIDHDVERAQFVILNEAGNAVVGGRSEIAAFDLSDPKKSELWRARHTAPGRGILKTIAGVALRAAALYFRYGGVATSALGVARGGLRVAAAANSFRWSGLRTRFGSVSLTSLASNAAKNYVSDRIYAYGSLGRTRVPSVGVPSVSIPKATDLRGRVIGSAVDRMTPSREDVRESMLDRLDPIRQAEKLSQYLLRRKRLAELRSSHMYFYTDLPKPHSGKGLVGVNVHNGEDARFIKMSDPDPMFVTDETSGFLYSADGKKLQAFSLAGR